jgi:hypothetical protein
MHARQHGAGNMLPALGLQDAQQLQIWFYPSTGEINGKEGKSVVVMGSSARKIFAKGPNLEPY